MLTATELAVWGDPIDHSRSPRLHAAAYRVLGLDWTYGRRRVAEAEFSRAIAELGPQWRGLSLTMPLKYVAAAAAHTVGRYTRLTGAANTYLFTPGGPHAYNTDVLGLLRALQAQGIAEPASARILGAGATATSALVALAELGARRVEVVARRPDRAAPLIALGAELGAEVRIVPFAEVATASGVTVGDVTACEVTVATLPGGADLGDVAERLAERGGTLFDVTYGAWPTPLATVWGRHARAYSGLGMLLHQALLQVRIFVTGDPDTALDDEAAVLAAMSDALVGD